MDERVGGLPRKEMNFPLAQPKASPGLDLFNGIRPVFRSQSFSPYCLVSIHSKVFPLRGGPHMLGLSSFTSRLLSALPVPSSTFR